MARAAWIRALALAAGLLSAPGAWAFDPEVLRVRLMPRPDPAGTPPDRLEVTAAYWKPEEMVQGERRREALRVTQDYVGGNLSTWVEGGLLEPVERLRRTDLSLTGDGAPAAGGLDVKLRVAERVRLSAAAAGLQRELTFDPVARRMWVDLYRADVKPLRTGVTLTNTYDLQGEGNRLMLNLRYRFE
jgi:hypothetical protein